MSDESAVAEADAAVETLQAPSEPAGQYDMADPDDDGPPQIEHAGPRVDPRAAKEPKAPKENGKPAGPKAVVKPRGGRHANGRAALNLPAASKPLEIADPDDHAPAAETSAPEPETTRDETPEATEAELPEISADLMRQAEAHGFTQEDAEDLGPDALLRAITASDRRELAALKAQAQREQSAEPRQLEQRTEQRREPQREPAPAPQRTPAPEPAAKTTSGFEKLEVQLDPKDYDEGTISVINKIVAHSNALAERQAQEIESLRAQIAPLGQQFEHVTGRFQAEDHARFTTDMDNFFDGLGDDFRDTFGKGPIYGMNPADATHKSREAFVNQMSELRMLDQIKGRQTSIDDLRQRAMRLLHSDKLEKQTRGKLVKAVEQRRSQSVARPTSRQSAPRTPDDAAVKFATNFLKDHGADGEAEAPDEI